VGQLPTGDLGQFPSGGISFSTAPCAITDLPFRATVELVDDPGVIVREFLDSRLRDGIPWTDLKEASPSADTLKDDVDAHASALRVWAVDLGAIA
jgi:hypothetical protein